MNCIYYGDNLPILQSMPSELVELIYIDPPFNTGKKQTITRIKTIKSEQGDRKGFNGNVYQTVELGTKAYPDSFDDYIDGFLKPRIEEAYRILKPNGSLYFHIDYREVHYCKILLDEIFGRECFLNEIIWAYDFGGKSKSKWPAKHDNILVYVKDSENYIFNSYAIDREPYMAPGLVGPEKAERGKLPTDTWWHTIVGTNSKERTGYPTQKPLGVINRIIQASSYPGHTVLDFFAGSGTIGESCLRSGRNFILIDNNKAALEVMANRFSGVSEIKWSNFDPSPYQTKKVSITQIVETNLDFQLLSSAAKYIQSALIADDEKWENSPFHWVLQLPAAKKGKLGRHLIYTWCASKGLTIDKVSDTDANLLINGHRIATKFSTLWEKGIYKFQQIRNQGYDFLVCLGISPYEVHCWVFDREYVVQHAKVQHKKGSEYWFSINPEKPPEWAKNYGGTLEQAYKILKTLKS
jgi:site-specific DNA-methyltransferase (adenine-specific)